MIVSHESNPSIIVLGSGTKFVTAGTEEDVIVLHGNEGSTSGFINCRGR